MRRIAPLAVFGLLSLVTIVVLFAPPSAAAARFRFGTHAMTARPAPTAPLGSDPSGRLGVSGGVTGVGVTPAGTNLLSFHLMFSDEAQGAVIGWSDQRSGNKFSCFASRFNSAGDLVSGWGIGGNLVSVSDSSQILVSSGTDGSGGGFFVYTNVDPQFGSFHDIYLQHLTSAGTPAGGYPSGGKVMATDSIGAVGMLPDGSGGLFFGWSQNGSTIRIKRLNAAGVATGGWSAGGLDTGVPDQVDGEPALDGAGGVYFAWSTATDIRIQRFTSSGTFGTWPAAGLVVSTPGVSVNPRVIRLSSGDALVAWIDPSTNHVFAHRINAAGTLDAGWPSGGMQVSTATGGQSEPSLAVDAVGGALIMWHQDGFFPFAGRPYVQRLTAAGGVFGTWPTDGVSLLSTDTEFGTSELLSDGANGAIAAWTDLRDGGVADIYAQRVLATGTIAWTADGDTVCASAGDQVFASVVTNGLNGAIVAWEDYSDQNNAQIRAAWVANDGTVAALASLVDASAEPGIVRLHWYTPDGSVTSASVERAEAGGDFMALGDVMADGSGHLRFEDRDVVAGATYRYRLAVPDGATITYLGQVTIRIPASVALEIQGFRPNPAEGEVGVSFALASGEPARLEVLDVAGRRMIAQEVGALGAGQHVVRLEKSANLPAGIYVVRLTQAGRTVTARAAIVR